MPGRLVHDDNETHAVLSRHRSEKSLQRFQSTGRGPESHNGKSGRAAGGFRRDAFSLRLRAADKFGRILIRLGVTWLFSRPTFGGRLVDDGLLSSTARFPFGFFGETRTQPWNAKV